MKNLLACLVLLLCSRSDATTFTMDSASWTVAKASCVQCHQASPYPAGIEMHASGTTVIAPSAQTIYDGIAYERAPANKMLSSADRGSWLTFAVNQGAVAAEMTVPTTFTWKESLQCAGASSGSDGQAAGRFFGFHVEDLTRSSLTIENYTDRNSKTLLGLALSETGTVNQDSFSLSTHPVNYIVPDGLAWCGRPIEFKAWGWVVQDDHGGVFFHTRELKKGASTTHSREKREYVRLQFSGSYLALRGKSLSTVDNVETYPWNTAPSDPWLTDESGYTRGVGSLFFNNDQWYWVHVEGKLVSGHMNYHASVRASPGGTILAEVGGDRSSTAEAFGAFGFFKYTQDASGHKYRWANWEMQATSVKDSGGHPDNGTGCHPPCELE